MNRPRAPWLQAIAFLAFALLLLPVRADAALAIDAAVSGDQGASSTTVTAAALTTSASGELLLALVATDNVSATNTTVTAISGGGLAWTRVVRSNAQRGTSEIWRAWAAAPLRAAGISASLSQAVPASITVIGFSGADATGSGGSGAIGAVASAAAATGAPAASVVTTRAGSWVLGVGNDWDRATARTPAAGQTLVHQYLAAVGDTYWVQRQAATTPAAGTTVPVSDTAPTGDRWNLAVVEVLPAAGAASTWSVAGTVAPAASGSGTTLTVTQGASTVASAVATSTGAWSVSGLASGAYTVTPSKAGLVFTPASQVVTVAGANLSGVNFTAAAAPTWSISGTVAPALLGSGAAVALAQGGVTLASTTADTAGNWAFAGLQNGAYTLTPGKAGISFTPASQPVTVAGANVTGVNFTGQALAAGIAWVQGGTAGNLAAGTSISATYPAANARGNLLVVTGIASQPAGSLTVTDSSGNAWGTALGPISDTAQNASVYLWYVPYAKGGANTVTLTASVAAALEIHVAEFSGADPASPLDQAVAATGTGTSASSGSRTTLRAGELTYGYGLMSSPTSSVGAGFTGGTSVNGDWDEYAVQAAPGAASASFTQPASGPWLAAMATFKPAILAASAADWPTYGHDPMRSGQASAETAINRGNVQNLALKWSAALDGKVTAQPLFMAAMTVAGQPHDVVVAATANNTVYALDAGTGAVLWQRHLAAPAGAGVIPGGMGISATPVIDRTTARVYTVTDDGNLHGLLVADGSDAFTPLPVIGANTTTNMVWGGLNLLSGKLYVATASDGSDTAPWWGRIVQVDVTGTNPVVATTFKVVPSIAIPNGGGGIWGYGGVTVDPWTGRVFAATAADSLLTGTTAGYTPDAGRLLALDPRLSLLGSYEPVHPSPCPGDPGVCDMDFGATPLLFQPPGCPPMVAAENKDGHLYALGADDLAASVVTSLQSLALNVAFDGPGKGGITGVPAYWPLGNMVYVTDGLSPALGAAIPGVHAGVVGLQVNSSCQLQVAWSVDWSGTAGGAVLTGDNQPPSPPTVADGVVFVGSGVNGSVHAYDAATGAELWNSGTAIAGGASFVAPSVANGQLFTATWDGFGSAAGGTVRAFALGATQPPPPAILLGDTGVEAVPDSNATGSAEAFQATAGASGKVTRLAVWLDAPSTASAVTIGLYADNGGHPGALLGRGTVAAPVAGAWNSATVPAITVSAGTPYWLAILAPQGSSGTLAFRDANGACVSESGGTGLADLPATWVSGTTWPSCPLSAYGAAQ